jgi:hypothetical protein
LCMRITKEDQSMPSNINNLSFDLSSSGAHLNI